MIVAHPDDDALFAGPFQIEVNWIEWTVVCATYTPDSKRGQEMIAWQKHLGATQIRFLNLPDDPADLIRRSASFTEQEVVNALQPLNLAPEIVLTHSLNGEYGHPHHKVVASAVRQRYSSARIISFRHFTKEYDFIIETNSFLDEAIQYYPSQEAIIRDVHRQTTCCEQGHYGFG